MALRAGSTTASKYAEVITDHVVHQLCADYGAPDAAWMQEDLAPCHAAERQRRSSSSSGSGFCPGWGIAPASILSRTPGKNSNGGCARVQRRPRTRKSCLLLCRRSGRPFQLFISGVSSSSCPVGSVMWSPLAVPAPSTDHTTVSKSRVASDHNSSSKLSFLVCG